MAKEAKIKEEKVKKEKVKKEKVKAEKVKKESFLKGTRKEMKQVIWPSGKDVLKYSLTTIFLVVFCVAFFILLTLLSSGLKELFN